MSSARKIANRFSERVESTSQKIIFVSSGRMKLAIMEIAEVISSS
jgi:hypothetical protein